ncbi:unnamed protein product [Brachionus calyciflorus]|uniref:Condensation domain-containing protein n=1 Tax=Brachionus calyciflorus TaxID=104777 RepID=A0A814LQB3_9BILA|nr:unnamed protein product [Brachionus calyciflorus]
MSQGIEIELTEYEKTFVNAFILGEFIVMGTSFISDRETNFKLNKLLVRNALVYLQKRHPYLNAYLKIQKSENLMHLIIPYEDRSHKIDLEWLDLTNEIVDHDKLKKELAKSNSIYFKYDNKDLLWKVQIIEYLENGKFSYLINLIANLAITDGMNICALSVEITNIINSLIDERECEEMRVKLEPLKDMYTLCKETGIFKKAHLEAIQKFNQPEFAKFILPKEFSSEKNGFNLTFFKMNSDLTEKILAKCKLTNIRITGYLQTIFLYAIRDLYLENNLKFPQRITVEIAASLRVRYVPNVDFSSCGFHTSVSVFSLDNEKYGNYVNFWQDAEYIHNLVQLNTSIETGSLFSISHDFKIHKEMNEIFAKNSYEEACKILNSSKVNDFVLSNLGAYINERVKESGGKFSVNELYCTDHTKPSFFPSIVAHVIYWKGQMMFQIGSNNLYFSEKYFDRFEKLVKENIDKSVNFCF